MLAISAACSRGPEPARRIVFLPFENLTGDDSLNWVTAAAPAIVAGDLTGVRGVVPLRFATISDGYSAQPARFVHGYFTRTAATHSDHHSEDAALRFEIEVEDAARHKMVETYSEQGDALKAMNGVAKHLDSAAHPFSTTNSEAVAAWGRGEFERAVTLDPDFGAARLGWAETLDHSGDSARAIDVASQALARPSLQSPLERARIGLLFATLHHDVDARLKALEDLTRLAPSDTGLLETLGQSEMNARRFADAARHFRDLLKLDPSNVAALNSLGYAEGFAGDLDAAHLAFENYGAQPGQKPNSLDSMGEVYFMHGKFADAEKYFLQAHQANQTLLEGQDLLKAAYSHWLAGDRTGADALMPRYLEFRHKQNDVLVDWREASWLFSTGRTELAISKLANVPNRQLAERQMAVWRGSIELPHDLVALKQRYENTAPTSDGQMRVLYAAALVAAAQKDEARPLLELWPMPWSPGDPLLESWVLPKFMELRQGAGIK
jgi:tetratricopeptide (TPR) repeat protein